MLCTHDLHDELPPMSSVQHATDLLPTSQLSGLPAYLMNPLEHAELNMHVKELLL